MTDVDSPVSLASPSGGRVSGKAWKTQKTAAVRTHLQPGVKLKSFSVRMEQTKRADAVKKLETELKEEKATEIARRREITKQRKQAAEERRRLEEDKAKMGARKAARLRRKAGRTKKING